MQFKVHVKNIISATSILCEFSVDMKDESYVL